MTKATQHPVCTIAYDKGYRVGKFIDFLIVNVKHASIDIDNKSAREGTSDELYNRHMLSVQIIELKNEVRFKIKLRNYDNNN